jgi:glucose/arabinose dehydrogenase
MAGTAYAAAPTVTTKTIANGLEHPWGVAALPDGRFLVTERTGYITLVDAQGNKTRLSGVPDITAKRQGGALGIALDPDFADNQTVYACLVIADESGATSSEVHKGQLDGTAWRNVEPVLVSQPKDNSDFHFGCRLTFAPDESLFVGLGDRWVGMQRTQALDNHYGKVLRIDREGAPHPQNPYLDSAVPEVYSIGHRNVQGLAWHEPSQQMWAHEHGPKGGDEINILKSGTNYGWPTITYGVNYNGSIITDKTAQAGLAQPLHYYVPSIAPSGMAFYGDDLLVGSLKFRYLRYIELQNGAIQAEYDLLTELDARIRDVIVTANGDQQRVFVLTDEVDGRLIEVLFNKAR